MGTLRVLLALSVLTGHASAILGSRLVDAGVAVHLFFVVSGFYMALILTEKYADRRTFYVNRVLRLWPTYLVVLAATWAWFYACWYYTGKRPPPLWLPDAYAAMPFWQALLLRFANFTMVGLELPYFFAYLPGEGFLFKPVAGPLPAAAHDGYAFVVVGQAWSISLELWFYLLAPSLVRRGTAFLAALAVASGAINLASDSFGIPTYFFFPAQLYLFVIGILLYRTYDRHRLAIARRPWGWPALAAVVAAFVAYEWLPPALAPYFMFAVCVPAIPWLFATFKDSRWDTEIGNLSYPIYLSHLLIVVAYWTVFHGHNGTVEALIAIAVSAALYLLVEKPVDRYRQALARGRTKENGRVSRPSS